MVGVAEYLSYEDVIQERGYKPAFVLTSVDDYDDEEGRRVIVSTIPNDIIFARNLEEGKKAGIKTRNILWRTLRDRLSSIKAEMQRSITNVSGEVTDADRALEGFMADLTVAQNSPQPYSWANVIFQNPIIVSPSGEQFFGTDFLKYGYPVWIQMGYVNNQGEIIGHPFSTKKLDDLPVLFGGLIGALDQEITINSGDRLRVQVNDYRWYLENFIYGQNKNVPQWVIDEKTNLTTAIKNYFEAFLADGAETAPRGIMRAMGFTLLKTKIKTPKVKFDNRVSLRKKPAVEEDDRFLAAPLEKESNYLIMLRRLENMYQVDINWVVEDIYTTSIVVSPRLDPYSMAFDKKGIYDSTFDKRVHQAILGGNVRNWTFGIDAAGAANRIAVRIIDPKSGKPGDSFLLKKSTIDEILESWATVSTGKLGAAAGITPNKASDFDRIRKAKPVLESTGKLLGVITPTYDDLDKVFGRQTRTLELSISEKSLKKRLKKGRGIKTPTGKVLPYSKEALEYYMRRLHYWGADGSIMLMGNANIKEGDLIEIFDKRPKGTTVLGFKRDILRESMKSFTERFTDALKDAGVKNLAKYRKNRYLGLGIFDNIYYIWKVRHFLGPQGFWTKVWYKKQRDSVGVQKSRTFATLRERAKKQIEGI